MHPGSVDVIDLERQLAIIEQQDIACDYVLVKLVVRDSDSGFVTVTVAKARIQEKSITVTQYDAAVTKFSNPDLRSLQITHNADIPTAFAGCMAYTIGSRPLFRFVAVRKI
jgi:hypothetical protein